MFNLISRAHAHQARARALNTMQQKFCSSNSCNLPLQGELCRINA